MSIDANGTNPIDIWCDAVAAYRAGKLDRVEKLCRRGLERQPGNIATLQLLAAAVSKKGAISRAIELLETVISLRPDSVEGHIQLARYLRLDGHPGKAVGALKKALELKPRSAEALNDLGLIYLTDIDLEEAITCFTRAIMIKPDFAIAHLNRGLACEARRDPGEAIASYRNAVVIKPDFAEAQAKLGSLLLFEGNSPEAITCFRRAAAAKPDSVLAYICEANILIEENKVAAAEEMMTKAINLDRRDPDALCLLGSIQMLRGRFLDAATSFEIALTLSPSKAHAYYQLVHVKKLTEADRFLIERMEWILSTFKFDDHSRSDLHFALGKAYDDLAQYCKAIEHYEEANQLRSPSSFDASQNTLIVDRIVTKFNAEFFSRNCALGSDWDAPLLIVGMPRSGTTLVEQILSRHPDVAAGGELMFWGEQVSSFRVNSNGDIDPAWVRDVVQKYRTLLTGFSSTARRFTDKRPHNFQFIGLIHSIFPRARIIHCCRHPVDTCLSIYFQNFATRMDFAYSRDDLVTSFHEYQRLISHWRKVLPSDIFFEVTYEELVADPDRIIRNMVMFCGLEWNDACLHSEHNVRAVRTASVWQARQPIYGTSVGRWRNYEPWLGGLRELIPNQLSAAGYSFSNTFTGGCLE